MLPLVDAAVAILSVVLSGDLALIRVNPDHPSGALWLNAHVESQLASDMVGALRASDNTFFKATGNKPLRFVFAAEWDGLGGSELVAIREKRKTANHDLDLRVLRAPKSTSGSTTLLASAKAGAVGGMVGQGRVIAAGAIDYDGNFKDELLLVREWTNGDRFLEIRKLPGGKNKTLGLPVATDPTFGSAADGEIVSVFGADADGDFHDEIVVVYRRPGEPDRLEVREAPTAPGGETGPVTLSCTDVSPADGAVNVGVSRIHFQGSTADRFLFVRRDAANDDRIEVFSPPTTVGAPSLGASIASDTSLGISGFHVPVFAAFGFESSADAPWLSFAGPWDLYLRLTFQNSNHEIVEEWAGPFSGFNGNTPANLALKLTFPAGPALDVALTSFDDGAPTDTGADPAFQSLGFYSTVSSSVVRPNDYTLVTYCDGVLHFQPNGRPIVSGVAPTTWVNPWIGNVLQAPSYAQTTGTVLEYKFVKQ